MCTGPNCRLNGPLAPWACLPSPRPTSGRQAWTWEDRGPSEHKDGGGGQAGVFSLAGRQAQSFHMAGWAGAGPLPILGGAKEHRSL